MAELKFEASQSDSGDRSLNQYAMMPLEARLSVLLLIKLQVAGDSLYPWTIELCEGLPHLLFPNCPSRKRQASNEFRAVRRPGDEAKPRG